MIELDTIEKQQKEIHEETLRLKNRQPFFNGQAKVNIIHSGNLYDHVVTGSLSSNILGGVVNFINSSMKLPFVRIIPVIGDTPGGELPTTQCSQLYQSRYKALYIQGGQVTYEFSYNINDVSGDTLYIKYYVLTNDTGGTFNGSWWLSW